MAETTWDQSEEPLINPSTGMPQVGGIICPWNRNEHGPAKQKIHCLVWRDWDDFNNWGSEGNFHFCRKICGYGRMEAGQRDMAAKVRRSFFARKSQREGFARKVKKQFKLAFPKLEVSKVARWDLQKGK